MTPNEDGKIFERAYRPRLLDAVVEQHLQAFAAVEIAGTMWSGKTWTSLKHGNSSINLDGAEARMLAELSPDAVLDGDTPRVVDEWQLAPSVWDAVRRRADAAAGKRGLFILTGSSRPSKGQTMHSGAGRISRLRMRPMSLQESGDSNASVSLAGLFEGAFSPASASCTPSDLAQFICKGGWPGALDMDADLASLVATQYLDALVTSDDQAAPADEGTLRLFLQTLARNIGSAPKLETLAADMGYLANGTMPESTRKRIHALLAYFENRFVIETQRGWDAPVKSPQRLRTKARYDFADPSLPAALLGLNADALLGNMQVFGQLFEQMCLRDLRVYASVLPQAKPDALRYYRDADGLEVDAIIELRDGRWGAIEIKLGANKTEAGVRSLLRLQAKIGANPAARNPEPTFLMVLVGVGRFAYQTPEGVYVVPLTCLGA